MLGLDAPDLARLRGALAQPQGLVLATGPTGSGKTTTLYAALAALNTPAVNVCTVEDPGRDPAARRQPGARRATTSACRSLRPCAPSCARTPTSSWWVRSATSRPPTSRSRPPSPATWCSPPCTPTTRRPPSPGCSTWASRRSCVAGSLRARRGAAPRARRLCPLRARVHGRGPTSRPCARRAGDGRSFDAAAGCAAAATCAGTGYRGRAAVYELMPTDDVLREAHRRRRERARAGATRARRRACERFVRAGSGARRCAASRPSTRCCASRRRMPTQPAERGALRIGCASGAGRTASRASA